LTAILALNDIKAVKRLMDNTEQELCSGVYTKILTLSGCEVDVFVFFAINGIVG